MYDKFLSADIFRVNSSASSRRTPRGSARIRADSAGVRRTFAGRSAESARKKCWRKFAGSARNRAESARFRADSRGTAAEGPPPSQLPKFGINSYLGRMSTD